MDDKVVGDEARDKVVSLDDLDGYLDMIMLDQTMSIAKAKKGGDLVAIVECPCEDPVCGWVCWPPRLHLHPG